MKHKLITAMELYAASAWLAGVSLRELAGSDKVSEGAFKTCHRVYTQLDTMTAKEAFSELDKRKEAK